MEYRTDFAAHSAAIAGVFRDSFAASEGAEEGALIADLAARLMRETPGPDLRVVSAWTGGAPVAAILFTRLAYADARAVFLLSPVAVAPEWQGRGIGQGIIAHGLDLLRADGADIAVTYGDPAFYGRVGFRPVTQTEVPAPHALQYPEGWQARSLTGGPLEPLPGPASCAPAFDDPALW